MKVDTTDDVAYGRSTNIPLDVIRGLGINVAFFGTNCWYFFVRLTFRDPCPYFLFIRLMISPKVLQFYWLEPLSTLGQELLSLFTQSDWLIGQIERSDWSTGGGQKLGVILGIFNPTPTSFCAAASWGPSGPSKNLPSAEPWILIFVLDAIASAFNCPPSQGLRPTPPRGLG